MRCIVAEVRTTYAEVVAEQHIELYRNLLATGKLVGQGLLRPPDQEEPAPVAAATGSALAAIAPELTLHCLREEVRYLRQRLDASEAEFAIHRGRSEERRKRRQNRRIDMLLGQ